MDKKQIFNVSHMIFNRYKKNKQCYVIFKPIIDVSITSDGKRAVNLFQKNIEKKVLLIDGLSGEKLTGKISNVTLMNIKDYDYNKDLEVTGGVYTKLNKQVNFQNLIKDFRLNRHQKYLYVAKIEKGE